MREVLGVILLCKVVHRSTHDEELLEKENFNHRPQHYMEKHYPTPTDKDRGRTKGIYAWQTRGANETN